MKDLVTKFKTHSEAPGAAGIQICLDVLVQSLASLKEGESLQDYVASVYLEGYK